MSEDLNTKTSHILIPVDTAGKLHTAITATDPHSGNLLRELAKSLDIAYYQEQPPFCKVFLQCDPGIKGMIRNRQGDCITIRYSPAFVHDNREAFLLRECIYAAITLENVFNRREITLFHGTFLEENTEEGILLFGESGIGKSTSRKRWLDENGTSVADDAQMLIKNNNQYFIRPLPTWSHWLTDGNTRIYPVQKAFRVRAMYWLSRDPEEQKIVPAAPAKYHCQLLSAMLLHSYGIRQTFTTEEVIALGTRSWEYIQQLGEVFPALEFRAHLDFPLKKTFYAGGQQ